MSDAKMKDILYDELVATLKKIDAHEDDCKHRGVGYDHEVHYLALSALSKIKSDSSSQDSEERKER